MKSNTDRSMAAPADTRMARVVTPNPSYELAILALHVMTIPLIEDPDAVLVFPGQGEIQRVQSAVQHFDGSSARYFLATGIAHTEQTYVRLTAERLAMPPFGLVRKDGIYSQEEALHTKAQCEWVVGMVQQLGITSLALHVSPYHLLRAWLTLIKTFTNMGAPRIPIVPVPVNTPPSAVAPEVGATFWELTAGELARIEKYQKQGDVATFEDAVDWINWQRPVSV